MTHATRLIQQQRYQIYALIKAGFSQTHIVEIRGDHN